MNIFYFSPFRLHLTKVTLFCVSSRITDISQTYNTLFLLNSMIFYFLMYICTILFAKVIYLITTYYNNNRYP